MCQLSEEVLCSQQHVSSAFSSASQVPRDALAQSVATAALALNADQDEANKLTLVCVVGQGSWGTVYRGVWKGLDVAVKTLVFSGSMGKAARGQVLSYERAVNEAAVCTSVVHRNIVSTYRYDVKLLQPKQEVGQFLEVNVDAAGDSGTHDFKVRRFKGSKKCSALHVLSLLPALLLLVWELTLPGRGASLLLGTHASHFWHLVCSTF